MIAKHVLEKDRDIHRAQEFMTRCPLLKIEDLLPFFPTEVLINDFKEAICSSLEMYNREIERLKVDMEESTKSASLVREDIQKLANRIIVLQGNQKCDACHGAAISRLFYHFPCQHVFHLDCLMQELQPFLNRDQLDQMQEMIAKIDREAQNERPRNAAKGQQPDPTQGSVRLDALKTRLDEVVGTDCVYCGDFMLRVINEPFATDQLSWLQVDSESLTHM
jgi:vacuolar protein sorting-associated protein 18